MAIKPPNIPALSSRVDSEVKRAFAALKDYFSSVTSSGGVVTESSLATVAAETSALAPYFDGTLPPQLNNLVVTGAFRTIMLAWDDPSYTNLSHIEIWRNTVDDLGTAVVVGTSEAMVYADTPPNASLAVDYYYWIRAVGKAGVPGPFNATLGIKGNTANDPEYVLEILEGQLTTSELHADLTSRIDLIDFAPGNALASIAALDIEWGESLLSLTHGQALEVLDRAAGDALEATARANAFVAEAAARSAAILIEANARTEALISEASARAAGFLAETSSRNAAIQAEADMRASAILAESLARGAAITVEATERQAVDESLSSSITTLTASVNNNASAIQSEATTRAEADLSEAALRTTLASRVTSAESDIATNTAAITSESSTRATADSTNATNISNLAVRVSTAEGDIIDNAAAIFTEATARATADSAEALLREALTATVSVHTAAIAEEQLVRATANETMASDIETMAASVLNTVTTITNESVVRATETSALAQSISLMTAGVSGGFDAGEVWYFDADVEGWTGSSSTITQESGWIRVTATGLLPKAISPVTSIIGSQYSLGKMRVKRVAGTGWTGMLCYSTSGHGFSESYQLTLAEPAFDAQDIAVIDFEMSVLTQGADDWVAHTITGLEITLGATVDDVFDIDYIAIGRSAPGASVASVTAEALARADAIASEAATRNALAIQLRGSATGTDINTLTSGLLYNERVARVTAVAAEVVARQALEAVVNNAATGLAAAHAAVAAEQTARTNADSAEAALRVTLAAAVNNPTTGLAAAHSAIASEQSIRATADAAEAIARAAIATTINNPTTGLVAAHSAISTEQAARTLADETIAGTVTTLSSQVNNVTTGLPAAHSAIVAEQQARVSEDEAIAGTVTTLSAQVNNVTTGLPAAHSAITEVAGTVATNELATSTAISTLESDLNTPTTGLKARLTTVETTTTTLESSTAASNSILTAELDLAGEAILGGLSDMTEVQKTSMAYIVDERDARVTALDAVATTLVAMEASIGDNAAGLVSESTVRANADLAEAEARTLLTATVNDNHSYITTNYSTTTTVTGAIAAAQAAAIASSNGNTASLLTSYTNTTTMTGAIATAKSEAIASSNGTTAGLLESYSTTSEMGTAIGESKTVLMAALNASFTQTNEPLSRNDGSPLQKGDFWNYIMVRDGVNISESLVHDGATWVYTPDAAGVDNAAAIAVEQEVRATTVAPDYSHTGTYPDKKCVIYEGQLYRNTSGSTITNAGAWTGTGWTAITSDLYAQYGVRLDVNGKVVGFGLSNDGDTSDFEIVADKFTIAPVGTSPAADGAPFYHLTTATSVDGTMVPAGTYMKNAYIVNLTADNIKANSISVDRLYSPYATLAEAVIGEGHITNAMIGDTIQSTVYTPGSAGWHINKNGTVEFNGGTFRGKVVFGSTSSGYANIDDRPDLSVYDDAVDMATNVWTRPGQTTIDGNKISTGDLGVDTLQIKGQAVTFPMQASRYTSQSFYTVATSAIWASSVSVNMSLSGANVIIQFDIEATINLHYGGPGTFELIRTSSIGTVVVVHTIAIPVNEYDVVTVYGGIKQSRAIMDTPTQGIYTYGLRISASGMSTAGGLGSYCTIYAANIVAMEAKR